MVSQTRSEVQLCLHKQESLNLAVGQQRSLLDTLIEKNNSYEHKKKGENNRNQFMSFIDSQQFSPIQSVQDENSEMVLADEVEMFKSAQSSEKKHLNKQSAQKKTVLKFKSLKKLIDFQRKS